MDGHFRAFSFVDRVTDLDPGRAVAGVYLIPAGVASFVPSLVAEAIGQLAAWAAMSKLDFTLRPVAGIAKRVDFLSTARPGQTMELTATLDSVDESAVAYSGCARIGGREVLRLVNCVGPMLPATDFDDPEVMRRRFDLLREGGAIPGLYGGVPEFALNRTGGHAGEFATARLGIPASAPFFADHFPRRPIFPGTLLVHCMLRLAADFASEVPGPTPAGSWQARDVVDVKIRSFTEPGAQLDLEARLKERDGARAIIGLQCRNGARLVGSTRATLDWVPAA
jgi:3-hydroxymyristoyl/3-hydroxydecanoyl-(acyl carrier protein) dehydratase